MTYWVDLWKNFLEKFKNQTSNSLQNSSKVEPEAEQWGYPKVWTEILKKNGLSIWGPNGPNRPKQHENLRLKHQNIGKRFFCNHS